MMPLSKQLQKRVDSPFHKQKRDKISWKTFLYVGLSDTGRPEDRYRVEFFWSDNDSKQQLNYETNLSGPELGLLQATVELAERRQFEDWISLTEKELDFYLRDVNSQEIGPKELIDFEAPLLALKSFARFLLVEKTQSIAFSEENNGPFAHLSLQEKLEWLEKALNSFTIKENMKKDAIELLAIDKLLVILRVRNVDNLEKLLDDIQVYLNKYFNEAELNVIAE